MAIVIRVTGLPEGAGTEMYDRVHGELNLDSDPPQGLIFHMAGEIDGEWTVTDVWESQEDYDRFASERLGPAIEKVSGMSPGEGPQATTDVFEVHNHWKG